MKVVALKGPLKGSEEASVGSGSRCRTSSQFVNSGSMVVAVEEEDSTPQVPGGLTVKVIIYSANDTRIEVCNDKNSPSLSLGGTMIKAEWGIASLPVLCANLAPQLWSSPSDH